MAPPNLKTNSRNAIRNCLEGIPFLSIHGTDKHIPGVDLALMVKVKDKTWTLLVNALPNGQPRTLRQAVLQLHPLLADRATTYGILTAPFISPDGALICEEAGLGYLDLAGNCRLSFGTVFVEKQGRPNPYATSRDLASPFRPKATRILRVLLSSPKRSWGSSRTWQQRRG